MSIQLAGNTVIHDNQNVQVSGVTTASSFVGDGSQLTNLPASGGTLEATASGTLADGSKVIVNADGTVSVITQTETLGPGAGTPEVFASTSTNAARSATYDSTNNKVVVAYQDGWDSDHGKAVVGTVNTSTNEITFGSPTTFASNGKADKIAATFDSTNSRVVIAYEDAGNSSYGTAVVGQVSGTSISFGTPVVYEYATTTGGDVDIAITFDSTNGKVVIAYRDAGNSSYGTAIVGNVNPSTNSITFGSPTVFYQGNTQYISATFDSSNGRVVIAYSNRQSGQAYQGESIVGTVSGTGNSISFPGSTVEFNSGRTDYISTTFDASKNRVVIAFIDMSSGSIGKAIVGNVNPSTNAITFGSEVTFNSTGAPFNSAVYDASNNNVVISYMNNGNSNYGTAVIGTVDPSNNSIEFGSSVVFESAGSYWTSSTYTTDGKVVISYLDNGNSNYGTAVVFGQSGFSPVPQIGSPAVYNSNGNTPYNSAVYDSTNNKVVVAYRDNANSNYGTAIVGAVSGTSISFGTPVVFESSNTQYMSATFDSSKGVVVIAYGAGYGRAIVGTVSGTSIGFGSSSIFESGYAEMISATFDSTNNKVVIAYIEPSNDYGKAVVGTVNTAGTAISYGSLNTFHSTYTSWTSSTFDSTNSRVIVAYQDSSNSNRGTVRVGTVSGTSINFGSEYVFETGMTARISSTFDSTNGKVVIAYYDQSNSYYGTAVVGDVNPSTNAITFGTPVVFEAANTDHISSTFDSTNGKVVIAYRDSGNSQYGTAIVGTVSGTTISFESPVVFESASTAFTSAAFDSTNDKVVFAYMDSGNSSYGTATVFSTNTITTNLTSENFIGISDGAYSNGQTATIQISGSIDDAQSGLTPGSKYYVQGDGTLSTSAGNPSVLAGTAVATTKLIINTQ